jgi:hypothetical protein
VEDDEDYVDQEDEHYHAALKQLQEVGQPLCACVCVWWELAWRRRAHMPTEAQRADT